MTILNKRPVKKPLKITSIIVLCLLLVFIGLLAYSWFRVRAVRDTRNLEDQVAELCQQYLQQRKSVGLAVGIIRSGQVYLQGFGQRDRTSGAQVDEYTEFEIGSITKVFTAEMAQVLADRNILHWDDLLAESLEPGCAPTTDDGTTLLSLATHTSGYPRMPKRLLDSMHHDCNPYADIKPEWYCNYIRNADDKKKPDVQKYGYSNIGFSLLANALEWKTSKKYEQLLRELICNPLGMTHTGTGRSSSNNIATGYDLRGYRTCPWDFPVMYGCGAIRSNIRDMVRFAAANLSDQKKSASLRTTQEQVYSTGPGEGIAKGWHIDELSGKSDGIGKIIWHNGGTGGFRSYIGLVPGSRTAVVVLANQSNESLDDLAIQLLIRAVKVSFGATHQFIPR